MSEIRISGVSQTSCTARGHTLSAVDAPRVSIGFTQFPDGRARRREPPIRIQCQPRGVFLEQLYPDSPRVRTDVAGALFSLGAAVCGLLEIQKRHRRGWRTGSDARGPRVPVGRSASRTSRQAAVGWDGMK